MRAKLCTYPIHLNPSPSCCRAAPDGCRPSTQPANVLISQPDSERPIVKIADFGLSRLLDTAVITRNPDAGTVGAQQGPRAALGGGDVLGWRVCVVRAGG